MMNQVSQSNGRALPLRLPLQGQSLIEASAGTGKTFTLALMYARLILNHGNDLAFGRCLTPKEILVVTFTKAATQELRDRIRDRLVQMADYLRSGSPHSDLLLLPLYLDYDSDSERFDAAKLLEIAAEEMDEAAVSTIHAWCYRVLKEFSLLCGGSFDQNILESDTELLQQVAEDYWRLNVLTMSQIDSLEYMIARFKSPSGLLNKVKDVLPYHSKLPPVNNSLHDVISKSRYTLKAKKEHYRTHYLQGLKDFFDEAKECYLHKDTGKLTDGQIKKGLDALEKFLSNDEYQLKLTKELKRLALIDMTIWVDPNSTPPNTAPSFELAGLANLDCQPNDKILTIACHWIYSEFHNRKLESNLLSNEDLLLRLQQALEGPNGDKLAKAIRQRFPVALVDEFQDTDPVQYDIFRRVYGLDIGCKQACFVMIGDPKQAIYSFRGGDIYTYLRAREHIKKRQDSLEDNYRSDSGLVEAVNKLFEFGEEAHREGAFRLGKGDVKSLKFKAVGAGKDDDKKLLVNGPPQAPQTAWLHRSKEEKPLGIGAHREFMAEATANEIDTLLSMTEKGKAYLQTGDKVEKLKPKDLAILVEKKSQAEVMRKALSKRKIASVYLSDSNSVYSTPIAKDLLQCLRAVADPDDDRLVTKALATRVIGFQLKDLSDLQTDEILWENKVEDFHRFHLTWQRQGVLALIYELIFEHSTADRLLGDLDGERELTDLLHLAELLQQASLEIDGIFSLVRHFEQLMESPNENDMAQQQRLESDSDVVQIVTIHKSKGLEYPIVFTPFLSDTRVTGEGDFPLVYQEADDKIVTLRTTSEALAKVENERKREAVRLLYVALTRASHCQYLGLGEVVNGHASGIGVLLNQKQDVGELEELLSKLADSLTVRDSPENKTNEALDQEQTREDVRPAKTINKLDISPWSISSYSAIAPSSHSKPVVENNEDSAKDSIFQEEQEHEQPTPSVPVSKEHSIHTLPKGAACGTMWHEILEDCAAHGFAEVLGDVTKRSEILAARMKPRQVWDWHEAMDAWLVKFLNMPWNVNELGETTPIQLNKLGQHQLAVEMEFFIATNKVDVEELDRKVCEYSYQGKERTAAPKRSLQGLLKGYIDLTLEHEGKYYVVDWKSTYLGTDASAYTADSIEEKIINNRYELQYVLYTLALHRLLSTRIPDYDYERHIGGAIYVFMRGIDHPQSQGLIMDKPKRQLIEELDVLFKGES